MKKFLVGLLVGVFSFIIALSMVACNNSSKKEDAIYEEFAGKWYCYKTVAGGDTVDFREFPSFLKFELSIEFFSDKTYIVHYYVNGEEGKEYPHKGTFSIVENGLSLTGDTCGHAEISETGMILILDGVIQYYQRDSF